MANLNRLEASHEQTKNKFAQFVHKWDECKNFIVELSKDLILHTNELNILKIRLAAERQTILASSVALRATEDNHARNLANRVHQNNIVDEEHSREDDVGAE